MNLKNLNQDLIKIVEKRIELDQLTYDDERYDDLEEVLHDLEDDFIEKYGDYLEDALIDVHDEYCPEAEVLSPIAYVAKKYAKREENGKVQYEVNADQGVWVEIEQGNNSDEGYLVLLPSPTRLVLMKSPTDRQIVWKAKE
ncbi:MAG: hypothetical protein ACFB0B_16805 [Thermonemataceae bacterium]